MRTFPILTLAALTTSMLAAESPPNPAEFAKNGEGLTFEEFFRFQLQAQKPSYLDVDTNGDGVIDEAEKRAFCGSDWHAAHMPAGAITMPIADAAATIPLAKPKSWGPKYLHLRKDHDSLSKNIGDADPASFGFYRNNITGQNTWAVEAALGLVIPIVDRNHPPELGNYYMVEFNTVTSAALNRITGTGDGSLDIADSLALRAGLSWQLQARHLESTWWNYQLFNLDYRATGTTSGGGFKSGGEFGWEPTRDRKDEWFAINGAVRPFGHTDIPFMYAVTIASRLEFGEDQNNNSFLKLGPKVGCTLVPTFLPNLSLFGNYTYMWEAANGERDFDYLETGFRWTLDQAEQIFLEGKYRFGQLPAKYTDIDLFQIALSLKF